MKNKLAHKETYASTRILNLKRINNTIDLTESYLIIDGKVSKELFESEIYSVTFAVQKKQKVKSVNLYLSSNEIIGDEDIEGLKEQLGIEILGDGSFFEIVDYNTDFTINFDQENTVLITTEEVKKGSIVFNKKSVEQQLYSM